MKVEYVKLHQKSTKFEVIKLISCFWLYYPKKLEIDVAPTISKFD